MMYSKAKKIVGYWCILLASEVNKAGAKVQFRSLSRKMANEWAAINEPLPAAEQLNVTSGAAVWRARTGA